MGQDIDVARVVAALRAPGIRYRSFGNQPVRAEPDAPAPSLRQALARFAEEAAPQPAAAPPPG
ncbi:hypothetical protein, partial [Teichococcus cervicalis]